MMGISPLVEIFGFEKDNKVGKLTFVNDKNEIVTEFIPSKKGNFNGLFEEVFNCIRNQKEFSVKDDEIIWQLKLLSNE